MNHTRKNTLKAVGYDTNTNQRCHYGYIIYDFLFIAKGVAKYFPSSKKDLADE